MLVAKKRLDPGADLTQFLHDMIQARALRVLPITPEIAALSQSRQFSHGDPADRIISATALYHHARLISTMRSSGSSKCSRLCGDSRKSLQRCHPKPARIRTVAGTQRPASTNARKSPSMRLNRAGSSMLTVWPGAGADPQPRRQGTRCLMNTPGRDAVVVLVAG